MSIEQKGQQEGPRNPNIWEPLLEEARRGKEGEYLRRLFVFGMRKVHDSRNQTAARKTQGSK